MCLTIYNQQMLINGADKEILRAQKSKTLTTYLKKETFFEKQYRRKDDESRVHNI